LFSSLLLIGFSSAAGTVDDDPFWLAFLLIMASNYFFVLIDVVYTSAVVDSG
jgi:hypothetical protein